MTRSAMRRGIMCCRWWPRLMLEETRSADTVARVGGDEFTVILPDVADIDVLRPYRPSHHRPDRGADPLQRPLCDISASIGTVWIQSSKTATRETVMEDADIALYASKNHGRARQTFYSPALRGGCRGGGVARGRGGA